MRKNKNKFDHAIDTEAEYVNQHKTVLMCFDDEYIEIDKGIAPLIHELWRLRIKTRSCCENVGDMRPLGGQRIWAYIQFEDMADAKAFLEAVTKFKPGGKSLYNRISHQGCRGVVCWKYEINPVDRSFDELEETYAKHGKPNFDFNISIYFPRSDIKNLLIHLRNLPKKKAKRKLS